MQSVWLQDIPLRSQAISWDSKADDFPAHFEKVLDALGAREGLKALRADVRHLSILYANVPLIYIISTPTFLCDLFQICDASGTSAR